MNKAFILAFGAVIGLAATAAMAERYKVERMLETTHSPDAAWDMIGDFCDLDDWHPAISGCRLTVIDGKLHRILDLAGGGEIVERRVAEEPGLSYTYSIVTSPLPLDRYTGTLSITRGEPSVITWSGQFDSDDPESENLIGSIYEAGLAAIEARLAN